MILLGALVPVVVLGALIAAIVAGFRAMSGGGSVEPGAPHPDMADVAKSVAIHVCLFLAMLTCTVGLIDLMQSFVETDRLAGSSSDVARGLALLIVGAPVFGALLRTVRTRYADRAAAGDTEPHRGWSVYLVVSLTVTLVASLASVVQIADRVTSPSNEFEPEELMQLMGWLGAWLAHWFVLRPLFRVRGDVHLAAGTIIGLGFVISGVGAVVYRVLDSGYHSAFDRSLVDSFHIGLWIVIAVVGAVVWAWHWLVHFDAAGSVEGDRRGSGMWFFTVVVAGVIPGLIAMVISATSMVSGVAIWFLGSTTEDAADFFEPAAVLATVLFMGLITWAYHRWELDRRGDRARNESLRFHDYIVLATALTAVVGSTAAIVALFIDAISAGGILAGSLEMDNQLIVSVTVLAASTLVWWRQWALVERHRAQSPLAESDSIWRKLYLIVAFGLGGVVLGVSTIGGLFVFLRDLIDGVLGDDTLRELTRPLGWGIAVLGAVWYHLGVWRSDRGTLAAAAPLPVSPPPPSGASTRVDDAPPSAMEVPVGGLVFREATAADDGELFTLQRAAAAEQARRAGRLDIAALHESFEEMSARLGASTVVVALDGTRIIGFTSRPAGRGGGDAVASSVMVAPDRAVDEVAPALLAAADRANPPHVDAAPMRR